MPPTVSDLQEATPRVLARLRQMAEFPKHGTVAGQAVASLFWEELNLPLRGPVNDIDVFVNVNMPREMRGGPPRQEDRQKRQAMTARAQGTVSNYKGARFKEDGYGQGRALAMRASTAIMRTYTAGLVNYTLVSVNDRSSIGHSLAQSQELVDEFDLNLVSVGINLDEEKVVASPAFLKFLADRQVRAQTANTPAHTLVRLVSKLNSGQLQGIECNYAAQREMLELAIACQDRIAPHLPKGDISPARRITRFGSPKYRALAQQYAHLLPPTHTKANASGYEFTYFDVGTPTTPQGRWLLEHCVSLANSDRTGMAHRAYVARFPALYSLFHSGIDEPFDPIIHDLRVASFKSAIAAKDSETVFRLVHFALGSEVPKIDMQELASMESAHFFFEQGLDADECQAIGRAWNALPSIEAKALGASNIRATDFQRILDDPHHAWNDLFCSYSQQISTVLAHSALKHTPPVRSSDQSARPLAKRFLSWLVDPDQSPYSAVYLDLLIRNPSVFSSRSNIEEDDPKIDTVFPKWDPSNCVVSCILDHLDADERAEFGSRLVNAKRPKWCEGPHGNDLVPEIVSRMDLSLPIEDRAIEQLEQRGMLRDCLIGACLNIEFDEHPSAYEALRAIVQKMAPRDLFHDQSQAIRSLAYTHRGREVLDSIKEKLAADPRLDLMLAQASEFLQQEIENLDDQDLSAGLQGGAGLQPARSFLDAWIMSCNTRPVPTNRSSLRF